MYFLIFQLLLCCHPSNSMPSCNPFVILTHHSIPPPTWPDSHAGHRTPSRAQSRKKGFDCQTHESWASMSVASCLHKHLLNVNANLSNLYRILLSFLSKLLKANPCSSLHCHHIDSRWQTTPQAVRESLTFTGAPSLVKTQLVWKVPAKDSIDTLYQEIGLK